MSASIITAFITGVLGPILLLVLKHYYEKRKAKPDMVAEALETSEKVISKLEHIKDEYHADRVWITQFHNGGHFYPTGKSIAKFSMVYETIGLGAVSIQSNFNNIPVSLFSKSTNHLLENDIISIPDYKDETIATYGLKYIADEGGCKSGYLFAIKTIDNKFIGTLGVDYTRRKTKLDAEAINYLMVHATAIGGVLHNHLQK
jgi:hypothetical protein